MDNFQYGFFDELVKLGAAGESNSSKDVAKDLVSGGLAGGAGGALLAKMFGGKKAMARMLLYGVGGAAAGGLANATNNTTGLAKAVGTGAGKLVDSAKDIPKNLNRGFSG